MLPRQLSVIGLLMFAACLIGSATRAALPPGAIKELKDKATDRLKVEIVKVEKEGAAASGKLNLIYVAKVLGVERSKSGCKVGDEIRIEAYHWKGTPPPGPRNPPLLKKGWKGSIYLNALKKESEYKLAAYGHSFEK